jgi:hypothetical protein
MSRDLNIEDKVAKETVLGIRIRYRIRIIFCLPDPDPLVKGTDPDRSLFS